MVFGAASVQNCTTITPLFVLIPATSFDVLIGEASFFSSAAKTAALNSTARRTDNFMLTNGTNAMSCRALRQRSGHATSRHLLMINQRFLDLNRNDRIERWAFVISIVRICCHSDFVIHVWYSCKLRTCTLRFCSDRIPFALASAARTVVMIGI